MKKIRIVAPPPGEAPQIVRDGWIGVELALPPGWLSRQRTYLTAGVLAEMLDGKRHFVFPADVCMSTDYDAGGDGSQR